MGCTQSADTMRPVAVEQSAAKPPAPVHKEAELIDHMTKGVENKASNGSNAGYMRAGDEKRNTDARERARASLIGTNPTFLVRVDPSENVASLGERVEEQVEGSGQLSADKVRQRKLMLSQASETFMVQVSPETDGDEKEVKEPEDPKARARKGMIGRNPTILVRMEAEDDPEARPVDLGQRVDEQIAREEKPADLKARARKGMIGRNPTLMDVADMAQVDPDELVRMDADQENAALEELRDAGLIKDGETFMICQGRQLVKNQ